jgi:metallophosphoesterase (TIGR00282 family)
LPEILKVLFLGDIIGQPGCRAIFVSLKEIINRTKADLVIANGENANEGKGILPKDADTLFSAGIDVITSGNHIWQKKEVIPLLETKTNILRPENYPAVTPGTGHTLVTKKGITCAVINLEGRVFLSNLRDPFSVGKNLVSQLAKQAKVILIDFHAELVEEKEALALYLDGTISALIGTHTHVQTADERILPGGTAYISDIGMTGPSDSVIGMHIDISINRCLTQMPLKMEVVNNPAELQGVIIDIDPATGKALNITRLKEKALV